MSSLAAHAATRAAAVASVACTIAAAHATAHATAVAAAAIAIAMPDGRHRRLLRRRPSAAAHTRPPRTASALTASVPSRRHRDRKF